MLQKLSKCEVKAWFDNLTITQILREIQFCQIQKSINVIFGNFRDSELWIWVNLGLESCSNLLKSKFRTSKIAMNDFFGLFEFAKIGFHVKSEKR